MAPNQMFSQMQYAALDRLAGRDPAQIARNAAVEYNDAAQSFLFSTLGQGVTVHYPDYAITPPLPEWHALVIWHYLDLADGTPLAEKEIPFGSMASGMVRGGGIDLRCEQAFKALSHLAPEDLAARCEKIGGVPIPSNADVAFRIPFLPRFPLTLKVWLPDEDFPASGRIQPDASADHYLTIEDAVTVTEILLEKLVKQR